MKKLIPGVAALALTVFVAAPAQAVTPTTQATASAKIYRPLTIASTQNLSFGTVVLNAGTWSGEVVSMTQAGVLTCGGGVNVTCSGTPTSAIYHLVGTNGAVVTVSSPGFNLNGPGGVTLAFTPNAPATVNLGATGSTTGVDFGVGGSITLASTTVDGLYTGNFAVTADYQ